LGDLARGGAETAGATLAIRAKDANSDFIASRSSPTQPPSLLPSGRTLAEKAEIEA